MRLFAIALLLAAQQSLIGTAQAACGYKPVDIITSPGFSIEVKDDYKILKDTMKGVSYGLYCGDSEPKDDSINKWFKVPVENVGVRIPIASGFLEALGKTSTLVAAESPTKLTNPCISDVSTLKDLSTTKASDAKLDVVFSGDENSDGGLSVQMPSDGKLMPLQLAEWVVFVSAFFDAEEKAVKLFKQIKDSYDCHTGNLKHLKSPPHAYWVQYEKIEDKSHYKILTSPYEKQILGDAGATNSTKEAPSDDTDQGAFQKAIEDADFVFDQTALVQNGTETTQWQNNFGYKDSPNSNSPFLLQRSIYRRDGYRNKNGISNFPEFALVRPDLVLQDFISILEPTYNPNHNATWLWKLGSTPGPSNTIEPKNYDCKSSWMATVLECKARTDFIGEKDSPSSDSDSGSEKDSTNKDKDSQKEKKSGGSRTGKIVGGVIGAIALIALGFVAVHYYNRNRQQARLRSMSAGGYGESIGLQNAGSYNRV